MSTKTWWWLAGNHEVIVGTLILIGVLTGLITGGTILQGQKNRAEELERDIRSITALNNKVDTALGETK